MKDALNSLMRKALAGILFMLLVGCATSEPSRFYLLSSLPDSGEMQRSSGVPCVSIGVGPVRLPEYTNRPQIVTRTTQNELLRAQFDLWAEPLSDTFARVLAENLARLVCTKTVALFLSNLSMPLDYRVVMDVMRMDGSLGKEAILEAWWVISSGTEKKVFVSRQSRFVEPVRGQDYEALVQAHSRILASFSLEIAQTINELAKENPPQQ
ncbi:MAG: hypothetical protein A4E62_01394 [Syntrophorhabdus sp. PtaU1.Bin002]|nr:MAG: hypothetical protein A4E58_03169 [Syntrophorhabdus sp. PtaB.Bin006]OPY71225.1 MAG: hypothetical protein A4E62_01394 [Syntrophorhabdus sp. PtaU1.Bin002]